MTEYYILVTGIFYWKSNICLGNCIGWLVVLICCIDITKRLETAHFENKIGNNQKSDYLMH